MVSKDLFRVTLAGFGGQGILFAGKIMVYAGMMEDKHVSWLPSYGPEMRGGTCNCSVIVADRMIGSPLFSRCDALLALNLPSYDKFLPTVEPGGVLVYDSSLITPEKTRDDIEIFGIPAATAAEEAGLKGLANVVMVGKLFKETGFASEESLLAAIPKCVSAKRPEMVEHNRKAFALGAGL